MSHLLWPQADIFGCGRNGHKWVGRREAFLPSVAELHLGDIKKSRGHEPSMYFCCEKNFLSEAVMVSKEFGKSLEDSQQKQQVPLQNRRGLGTGTCGRHSMGTLESCLCHNSHLLTCLCHLIHCCLSITTQMSCSAVLTLPGSAWSLQAAHTSAWPALSLPEHQTCRSLSKSRSNPTAYDFLSQ